MADQEDKKPLSIKMGEKRDAHNKIYTEDSVKKFIESQADDQGVSFSTVGRDYLLLGIKASGVAIEVVKP